MPMLIEKAIKCMDEKRSFGFYLSHGDEWIVNKYGWNDEQLISQIKKRYPKSKITLWYKHKKELLC